MAKHPLPDSVMLLKLLRYEAETGFLYWRARAPELFQDVGRGGSRGQAARWNGRHAGKRAGGLAADGYVHISIPRIGAGSQDTVAHRVIWCMVKGSWPINQIDHRNHVRSYNRMSNLREATNLQNGRNQSLMSHNTSGICGVYWDDGIAKWCAQIIVQGHRHYLGAYARKAGAASVRLAANRQFGFAEEHGDAPLP